MNLGEFKKKLQETASISKKGSKSKSSKDKDKQPAVAVKIASSTDKKDKKSSVDGKSNALNDVTNLIASPSRKDLTVFDSASLNPKPHAPCPSDHPLDNNVGNVDESSGVGVNGAAREKDPGILGDS